jgi:SsrA-binding protein
MTHKGRPTAIKKIVAENRKARYNYEIVDTYEAGLMLTGTEVKSLREGKANIAESYASDENGEIWLINSYLPEYLQANRFNHSPRRPRKLLLSAKEIGRLRTGINREGMTLDSVEDLFQRSGSRQARTCHRQGQEAARQARDREGTRLESREGPPAARSRLIVIIDQPG